MNRKLVTGTGLVVALALFLGINIIANQTLTAVRLDLTENNLYTLSEGSKNILHTIQEPVTVRFYYSAQEFSDVPQLLNYGKRVRDMLEEYVAVGKGQLKLLIIDPEPFSEAEDEAVGNGIRQLPLSSTGEMGYLGIVGTNATDDREVLPFLSPDREDALEYEITKMIYTLAVPQKRVIGVLTGLPVFRGPPDPNTGQPRGQEWTIFTLLKELYDVRELDKQTQEIDDDIDTLILIHPKDISQKTMYAVDQFVLTGGKAMIFVDPLAEQDQTPPDPTTPGVMPKLDSDLEPLFEKWGIRLVSDKVVGDVNAAVRVSFRSERGPQEVEYLPWLRLKGDALNEDDFVTNELNDVNVGSAGTLKSLEHTSLVHTPLIQVGTSSGLLERDSIIMASNPGGLLEGFEPDDQKHTIALRITGNAETAFPEGQPPDDTDETNDTGATENPVSKLVSSSESPINVIVVADTDLLSDRFWVRFSNFAGMRMPEAFGNNADFVTNAVDNLGGNDDLISLRSRGQYTRPFQVVEEIQRKAESQFRAQERALQERLAETESKLAELQSQETNNEMLLTTEQRAEIERFRQEQVNTRKELRAVQHDLQRNIDRLGMRLKFLNTALVPLSIAILAILISTYTARTRRQA